jgi:hypothetical protein
MMFACLPAICLVLRGVGVEIRTVGRGRARAVIVHEAEWSILRLYLNDSACVYHCGMTGGGFELREHSMGLLDASGGGGSSGGQFTVDGLGVDTI